MPTTEDFPVIIRQEAELIFPSFNAETAWRLGSSIRELAIARNHSIVIDIRRFGNPHQPLFYTALAGTTPDNARWVERKSNVVARFHRSSYQLGLYLKHNNTTLAEKYALLDSEYATHGGSFPLNVAGAGIIGSVTVSGLPQREDHNLVVEALCLELSRDPDSLRLPAEQR
jgi:uncharacterized protein (UPF0303 family)